jgi:hypothetical protein
MNSIVVSTWVRDSRRQQGEGDAMRRMALLRRAVAETNAKAQAHSVEATKNESFSASGFIKGIFVAPEYTFATRLAGFVDPVTGKHRGRSLHAGTYDRLMSELAALSRSFPRVLIIPGSIAWKKPIDQAELARRVSYYIDREAYKPKLSGDALTRALKGTWKRSTEDDGVYDTNQIEKFKLDMGRDMPTEEIPDSRLSYYEKNYPDWYKYMVVVAEYEAAGLYEAAHAAAVRAGADTGNITHMMSNTAHAFLNGNVVFSYHKQGNWQEELGDASVVYAPGGRSGVATIEEYTFGLEVCRDHRFGVLRQQLRPGRSIDVQIVISDWVRNTPNNVMAREGGFFIHSSTDLSQAGVWKVENGKLVQAPGLGQGNVGSSPLIHWQMDIDVYDPFDAGKFMKKMFRSG